MPEIELSASQEDYLEAIYNISQEKQAAKSKDIALALGVRAPSVTSALRHLLSLGLVNYAPYDLITLTSKGEKIAQDIVKRHQALNKFFTTVLGVDPAEADEAACKMEHVVSKLILERLIQYADYVEQFPNCGIAWKSGFCQHYEDNKEKKVNKAV